MIIITWDKGYIDTDNEMDYKKIYEMEMQDYGGIL